MASGMTSLSATNMISGRSCETMVRPQVAAGGRQLRIDPSGATTAMGRRPPALFGTSRVQRELERVGGVRAGHVERAVDRGPHLAGRAP